MAEPAATRRSPTTPPTELRRTVLLVALLNLAYFGVEFTVAQSIGSVALFADSVDFVEDASINLLIFFAVAWTRRSRSYVGAALAFVILAPTVATAWTAVAKILHPSAPEVLPLTVTAIGALLVNLTCALLLLRHRAHPGSLAKAAWLSARNDALANIAIVAAALLTIPIRSGWPDIVVGIGIGLLNAGAAWQVWRAAREERLPTEHA